MHRLLILVGVLGLAVILADAQAPTEQQVSSKGGAKGSPSEFAQRFVRLESGLLPNEWSRLSPFFAQTPRPQWNKVHIVDVVDVSIDRKGNSSHVSISTNSLGELDSTLGLSGYPSGRLPLVTPSTSACYGDDYFEFSLVLSRNPSAIANDRNVKHVDGPSVWRIEDAAFEPLITLSTAIRYVRQAREKSADPTVRANGARTLRILDYYKQGKPLPDEFSSGASSSCG